MNLIPCKNLDYSGDFIGCELKSCSPEFPDVKYWERSVGMYEGAPKNVQFCKLGGRVNGIFDCYGEMPCYEPDADFQQLT